jgi:hypothetical protein
MVSKYAMARKSTACGHGCSLKNSPPWSRRSLRVPRVVDPGTTQSFGALGYGLGFLPPDGIRENRATNDHPWLNPAENSGMRGLAQALGSPDSSACPSTI